VLEVAFEADILADFDCGRVSRKGEVLEVAFEADIGVCTHTFPSLSWF